MAHTRLFQVAINRPVDYENDQEPSTYDDSFMPDIQCIVPCDWAVEMSYKNFQEKLDDIDFFAGNVVNTLQDLGAKEAELVSEKKAREVFIRFKLGSIVPIITGYREHCIKAANDFKESFFQDKGVLDDGKGTLKMGDIYSFNRAIDVNRVESFYVVEYDNYICSFRGLLSSLAVYYNNVLEEKGTIPENDYVDIYIGSVVDIHY